MNGFRKFLRGFKRGSGDFGLNLSVIINSALLLLVYLMGVGITSGFAKLVKKSFLDTAASERDTYWDDLNLKRKRKESYYRQF